MKDNSASILGQAPGLALLPLQLLLLPHSPLQLQLLNPLLCSVPGYGPSDLSSHFWSLLCLKMSEMAQLMRPDLMYQEWKWYHTLVGTILFRMKSAIQGPQLSPGMTWAHQLRDFNTKG